MDKNTALRELDRYRALAKKQHKENEALLKELHEAWNEKRGCEALLAAVLNKCGQVSVPKEDVGKALKGELLIKYGRDEKLPGYTLDVQKAVNADGKE